LEITLNILHITVEMSAEAAPITPARFRLAIHDLPISNLHAKAAELRNSLAHLTSSNAQLEEFADAGDSDCADAIRENKVVMQRFQERLQMLREEVEGRGMRWVVDTEGEWEGKPSLLNGSSMDLEPGEERSNGTHAANATTGPNLEPEASGESAEQQRSGRLTDEELRLLMAARMDDPDGGEEEEGGLHL
jgi:hypothetical protein